ncbi:MAG: RNA polymerase sigma factor region1.1 domain-containing protein, partial [Nanoarchaeota archaeon]
MKKKEQPTKDMEKLIALGKQKGFLTYDEVNDLLPEDLSSTVAIDHLFELLGNEDIQVVEGEEDAGLSANRATQDKQNLAAQREELLTEQLKSEERFMPLDDPVKMYLKQMGSISLLSRENEIELAKKIEDAEDKFKRASLAAKFVRNEVLVVANDILEEKINMEEVVKEDIRIKKSSAVGRFKRLLAKVKQTRSDDNAINLILQLNFTTSVIEAAVRKLSLLLRELDYIKRSGKKSSLRSRQILKEISQPYGKIKEQMKLIKS